MNADVQEPITIRLIGCDRAHSSKKREMITGDMVQI